jgi:CelD/BcsL family acetyltransferase involved in cellulose biosynthesis
MVRIVLEREADAAWDGLVAADPESTIHHERTWLDCLDDSAPSWRPLYLLALDETGRLRGGIPAIEATSAGIRQLFSLPYGTYSHPLAVSPDDAAEVQEALLRRWLTLAGRPGTARAHLEWFSRSAGLPPDLVKPDWRQPKRAHLLDLRAGYAAVEAGFRPKLRSTCRQAERLGVTIQQDSGPEARAMMLALYREQAAAWPDHTPMRASFLHAILDRIPHAVHLWIARHQEQTVGATIRLRFGGMVVTWLTVLSPQARPVQAGSLLYRVLIEHACSEGRKVFNFGSSLQQDSIEYFKESFGAVPFPYTVVHHEASWFRAARGIRARLRRG